MDKFAFYVALLTRSRAQRLPVVAETVAQLLRRRHTHRTCKRPGLAFPPLPPKSMLGDVAWAPGAMLPRPRPSFPTLISGGGGENFKATPGRGRNAHFAAQFRKPPNFT